MFSFGTTLFHRESWVKTPIVWTNHIYKEICPGWDGGNNKKSLEHLDSMVWSTHHKAEKADTLRYWQGTDKELAKHWQGTDKARWQQDKHSEIHMLRYTSQDKHAKIHILLGSHTLQQLCWVWYDFFIIRIPASRRDIQWSTGRSQLVIFTSSEEDKESCWTEKKPAVHQLISTDFTSINNS